VRRLVITRNGMKKLAVSTGVALLAVTSVALAAGYKTGRYARGAQSGFKAQRLRIDIHRGSFNVERILMHETCSAIGHPTFHDCGGFQQGSNASLTGTINKNGELSGIYHDGRGGYTKVTGQITGETLTLKGQEASRYTPSGSTVSYSCKASGTFHPKHV
jgi:hypothetical protein